jgi:hypothetical protein
MESANAGKTLTIVCQIGETGFAVNSRYSQSAASAAASNGAESTGERGGRFTWNGLTAEDYCVTHGDDKLREHVEKVKSGAVSYNDLSKRADALAKKLGHEKVRVS